MFQQALRGHTSNLPFAHSFANLIIYTCLSGNNKPVVRCNANWWEQVTVYCVHYLLCGFNGYSTLLAYELGFLSRWNWYNADYGMYT